MVIFTEETVVLAMTMLALLFYLVNNIRISVDLSSKKTILIYVAKRFSQ